MKKTYQPFIINMAKKYIDILDNDANFFTIEQIKSTEYANELFCEELTKKFLNGIISETDSIEDIFSESEFGDILLKIITNNTLDSLVEKGYVNYFYDDNGEELFFLTENGKNIAKNLINNDENE